MENVGLGTAIGLHTQVMVQEIHNTALCIQKILSTSRFILVRVHHQEYSMTNDVQLISTPKNLKRTANKWDLSLGSEIWLLEIIALMEHNVFLKLARIMYVLDQYKLAQSKKIANLDIGVLIINVFKL